MYTPTNWQTGDTITAEKMNNIENGIVNAPKVAVVSLDAVGFSSSSHTFGRMVYATYDSEKWVVTNDQFSSYPLLWGYAKPSYTIIPLELTIVPSDTMCPFFINENINIVDVQTTGDIEEAENLYFSYGSHIVGAYRIYGNGSIKFIAL